MDVVYLVKNNPKNDSSELRYSLRSLRHIPHDKVVIVGEKPHWATNVYFIPVAQSDTKNANVKNNLRTVIYDDTVTDDFMLMNDDFFFLKDTSNMPTYNFGTIQDVIALYQARYPEGSEYIHGMQRTYDALVKMGYEHPLSYELHMPLIINKHKARVMLEESGGRTYQFRSYYGNYAQVGGTPARDVKIFLDQRHNDPSFTQNPQQYLEDQMLISTTGGAYNDGPVGEFVRNSFPDACIYES